MTTVAYVRVSTEDQVEYSPAAQAKSCTDLARLKGWGAVEIFADEGWSGKNLDRPSMQALMRRIEAGEVTDLVIWRWDRLSRDQGDFASLVKLFVRNGVKVHSVNEGDLDLASASGKMQIGVQGVFAQYYRDQIVENTLMGQRQAAEQGRWQNHAPTGYDMINGRLEPNEVAPLVQRVFELRAAGFSYLKIEAEVGIKYSTVRYICMNRVYIGEAKYSGEWYPGIHAPLVSVETFEAARRGHRPGKRRSRHPLSGKVRCGLCGRVAGVAYNERNQVLFRCKERGQGCSQPARSANGLQRAAVLGLKVLRDDKDLQNAINEQLTQHRRQIPSKGPSPQSAITSLKAKRQKLLDLYCASEVTSQFFGEQERQLTTQITTLESQLQSAALTQREKDEAADKFEQVARLLSEIEFETLWNGATAGEQRILIDELVDSVFIYPDQLTVQVAGAPPILIELAEVQLRVGSRPVVSEAGLEPARP